MHNAISKIVFNISINILKFTKIVILYSFINFLLRLKKKLIYNFYFCIFKKSVYVFLYTTVYKKYIFNLDNKTIFCFIEI